MPKGTGKINKAPAGLWSYWEPAPKPKSTRCPGCEHGHVVTLGTQKNFTFACSDRSCDWESPSEVKNPGVSKPMVIHTPTTKAKKKFHPDSPELVAAIRAEADRRMEILREERSKFPATNVRKGKKLVPNPKFTSAMHAHLHKFGFTLEGIRDELKGNSPKRGT
jgi:hypothetical protein